MYSDYDPTSLFIPGPGIVSETDKATSHLAEVAGQLGEEPTAKKKKAKGKVHMEDGITEGDKAKKLDMDASRMTLVIW